MRWDTDAFNKVEKILKIALSIIIVCIINFNFLSLSFENENLEILNWLQISMFNYTLF